MRAQAAEVIAEGALPERKMIRTYAPESQVAARLEISSGGMLSGDTAGLDVMGDGRVVAFRGGVVRRPLEPEGGEDHFDAVSRALR